MSEKEIVLESLKNSKCQPIKGCKENDDYFLATAWALEIEGSNHAKFTQIQQNIFRFLQKHASSETLFRLRREYENKQIAESVSMEANLFNGASASENILPHDEAVKYLKDIRSKI